MMLDPETFDEGVALALTTHELEMEDRDRYVASLIYLAKHAPGKTIVDGIASLSAAELDEYISIRYGVEPA